MPGSVSLGCRGGHRRSPPRGHFGPGSGGGVPAPPARPGGCAVDYCCLMSRALPVVLLLFAAACNNQPDAAAPASTATPAASTAPSTASSTDRKYLLER